MRIRFQQLVMGFVLIFVLPWPLTSRLSQQQGERRIEEILKGLSSSSWKDRSVAVRNLTQQDLKNDEVRVALFRLLAIEKNADGSWPVLVKSDAESEALIEYLGSLLETVITLKDSRSIPHLIRYIYSGMMVWRFLIENCSSSLPLVIERLYNGSDGQRHGAAITLGMMLSKEFSMHVSQEQRIAIDRELAGILEGAREGSLKSLALLALGNSGDTNYRRVIEKYLSDPDQSIRAGARMALDKLSQLSRIP